MCNHTPVVNEIGRWSTSPVYEVMANSVFEQFIIKCVSDKLEILLLNTF